MADLVSAVVAAVDRSSGGDSVDGEGGNELLIDASGMLVDAEEEKQEEVETATPLDAPESDQGDFLSISFRLRQEKR